MPFFEFHIHPVLKSQFSEKTATTEKFSPWEKVRKQDIPFMLKWCTEFQYILQSQSNLSQLVVNDCNLICAVLYISEIGMIDNGLIKSAAKGKLSRYLQQPRIDKIIASNPYQLLLNDDLKTLTDAAQFGVTDRKVKMLKKRSDYNENDSTTIHMVFTLEGCHSLCDGLRKFNKTTILKNLDDVRSKLSLISVNPTHIEQSPLCNHAFAMPYLDDEVFRPTGNRISNDGIDVIRHCYTNNILIDVKHMSLAARLHLYQLRSFGAFDNVPPLVCTHAGFTGISKNEIHDYIAKFRRFSAKKYTRIYHGKPVKYGGGLANPCFNPSSINLYDEDILEIINSGGMIGLSLDKRILGYQNYEDNSQDNDFPLEDEYVSFREEDQFVNATDRDDIGKAFEDGKCVTWKDVKDGGIVLPNAGYQHLKHFMAHVLHLIVITGANASQALKQICIGSDFDGMINPIWCCESMDEIYHFKQNFKDSFKSFAKESSVALPAGFDIASFCEDLFFRNGRDFVMKRLDVLNP
jgi:microsomal dipeptidase-like Zn-dependent dipeptidase